MLKKYLVFARKFLLWGGKCKSQCFNKFIFTGSSIFPSIHVSVLTKIILGTISEIKKKKVRQKEAITFKKLM